MRDRVEVVYDLCYDYDVKGGLLKTFRNQLVAKQKCNLKISSVTKLWATNRFLCVGISHNLYCAIPSSSSILHLPRFLYMCVDVCAA